MHLKDLTQWIQIKEKKQVNKIAAFLRKKAFRGYRTPSSLSDESFAAPASPRRTKYSVSQSLFTKLHFGSQMVIFFGGVEYRLLNWRLNSLFATEFFICLVHASSTLTRNENIFLPLRVEHRLNFF